MHFILRWLSRSSMNSSERLAAVAHCEPEVTFISNLTGSPARASDLGASYWRRHARQPVRFADSIRAARALDYQVFLEVGPSPVLLGMATRCLPGEDVKWLPSLRRGQADWPVMLQTLAELYLAGVRIDWDGFDRDYGRRRLVLPSYPFQRQRYWFREPEAKRTTTNTHHKARRRRRPGEWSLRGEMDSPDAAGRSSGNLRGCKRSCCSRTAGGLGVQLARSLETNARRCVLVAPGEKFRSIDGEHYEIDPTRPEDYDRLFREVLGTKPAADWNVIHLWSLDQDLGLDASASTLAEAQVLGCLSVLQLTQALARRVGAVAPRLWLLTRGVHAIGPQPEPAAVAAAPIWGLGKVIGLEHPEFRCVRLDLDPQPQRR